MTVQVYNQGDPLWRNDALGKETLGRYGCLVTCLASMVGIFGIDENPRTLCKKLMDDGSILDDGGLIWQGVTNVHPTVHFHKRINTSNDNPMFIREEAAASLGRIKKLLSMGIPVVLNVDNVWSDGRPDHWVLAYAVRDDGALLIMNPDGGSEQVFEERYGNPLDTLYGYAIIIGAPVLADSKTSDIGRGLALWKAKELAVARAKGEDWKVDTYAKEIVDTLL